MLQQGVVFSQEIEKFNPACLNSLRPKQTGRNFVDDIFKYIFLNGNFLISLKYVPYDLIDNILALVQIMAWRRTSDKPLSDPMMALFTEACYSTSMI